MRRTFLKFGAWVVLLLATLGLQSCTKEKPKHPILIGMQTIPVTLDPMALLDESQLMYNRLVFGTLITIRVQLYTDSRFHFTPGIAKKWKWLDNHTFRIWLNPAYIFYPNKTPVTVQDLRYSINRIKKSLDFQGLAEHIQAVKIYPNNNAMKDIADIIVDNKTPLIENVLNEVAVMNAKVYKEKGDALSPPASGFPLTHAFGAGPFYVSSFNPSVTLVLKKNPYYPNKNLGNVDQIIFKAIPNQTNRTKALLDGDVDIINPVPADDIVRLQKTKGIHVYSLPGLRVILFEFNATAQPALKDKRVRLAIAYAINQNTLVKNLHKAASAIAQLSPQGLNGYKPQLTVRYNLKKARQLMKEAGYEKGFTITIMAPINRYLSSPLITQGVANMLQKINIKVNIQLYDAQIYWTKYDTARKNVAMAMIGWKSDTMDSTNIYQYIVMCPNKKTGNGRYTFGVCSKKIDAMMKNTNNQFNKAKRTLILRNIAQSVYDDALVLPIYQENMTWGVRSGVDLRKSINIFTTHFENITIQEQYP